MVREERVTLGVGEIFLPVSSTRATVELVAAVAATMICGDRFGRAKGLGR